MDKGSMVFKKIILIFANWLDSIWMCISKVMYCLNSWKRKRKEFKKKGKRPPRPNQPKPAQRQPSIVPVAARHQPTAAYRFVSLKKKGSQVADRWGPLASTDASPFFPKSRAASSHGRDPLPVDFSPLWPLIAVLWPPIRHPPRTRSFAPEKSSSTPPGRSGSTSELRHPPPANSPSPVNHGNPVPPLHLLLCSFFIAQLSDMVRWFLRPQIDAYVHDRCRQPRESTPASHSRRTGAPRRRPSRHRVRIDLLHAAVRSSSPLTP